MDDPVIALITDFGEEDFFVGSLKGVIAKINPSARIIDITHRVPSHDILAANFILYAAYKYFPSKSIFLVIVDPGVGSSRKILLVKTKQYFFIAPDNGVLSLALKDEEITQIREVKNDKFFLTNPSSTFEGRDKMAPAASWLSKGVLLEKFGSELYDYEKIKTAKPQVKEREVVGRIIYIDKFGNLITNISSQIVESISEKIGKEKVCLISNDKEIASFKSSYSSVEKGEILFLVGSIGLIEIAVREGSAAERLKLKAGDEVIIKVCSM